MKDWKKWMSRALFIVFLISAISYFILDSAFGYPGITTTFSDGSANGTITLAASGSQTKTINLPLGGTILSGLINLTGQESAAFEVLENFEDGTIGDFDPDTLTLSAVTGQGSGSTYSLELIGGTADTASLLFNEANDSTINLSFQMKGHDFPYHIYIGDLSASTGLELITLSDQHTYLHDGSTFAKLCDNGDGNWHTYGLEINNLNETVQAYCDGDRKHVDFGIRQSVKNLTRIRIHSVIAYFDDFVLDTGAIPNYPHNLSIMINEQVAYTWGQTNNSAFDFKTEINLTPYLNPLLGYPTNMTFSMNTSGALYYEDLYFEDTIRNFTFTYYDEQDGTIFDLNATNSSVLTIQCPDSHFEYEITDGTFLTGVCLIE